MYSSDLFKKATLFTLELEVNGGLTDTQTERCADFTWGLSSDWVIHNEIPLAYTDISREVTC